MNYDAVHLLKLGIENAQSLDRTAIRDGLASIEMYEGVTGNMKFDNGNGDPTKSAVLIQISEGEFKYLDTVEP